jgi:hypothetical protein
MHVPWPVSLISILKHTCNSVVVHMCAAQLHSVNLYVTRKDHGLANSNKLSISRPSLPVGLVNTQRAT